MAVMIRQCHRLPISVCLPKSITRTVLYLKFSFPSNPGTGGLFECDFNVTQCQIPAGWLHIGIGWRLTGANYATTPQIGFISRVILSMQGSAEQFQQIIVKSDLFLSFCRSECQCFSSFVITGFKGAKHLETDCLPSLPWKNLGQEAREVQFNVIVFLCSAAATKKHRNAI